MFTRQSMSSCHGGNNASAGRLEKGDLTDLIVQARHDHGIPAMAVIIMDSERLLLSDIQGERVAGSNNPALLDDYFHIGSCAKSILAVMAGRLVEQGDLNWDTPFFDLYPELKAVTLREYLSVTLEDLLLCKAGIMPFTTGGEFAPLDTSITSTREAFIQYLIQQIPAVRSTNDGYKHLYSNASYTMASAMLERVSGLTWEEMIEQTLSKDLVGHAVSSVTLRAPLLG